MSTAQGGPVSSVGYAVMLVVCLTTAYREIGEPAPRRRRPHPTAVTLWLVVAVPSLVGLAWTPIFDALSRRPALIEDGQVWRLLTSVVVQDGGVAGTLFNLVTLALTLPAAIELWGPVTTVLLFVAGALLFNVAATFLHPEAGGGNSGATFFLATSLVGLLARRHLTRRTGAAAGVVVLVGIVLLVVGDAHGEAVLAGVVAGAGGCRRGRTRG